MTDKTKKTILIVEDNTPERSALCDKFTREGFEVLEAKNGEEGLLVSLREHPDLILLDIIMPVMDGISMLKKIRTDAWGKDVKVVILTNLSDSEKMAEALDRGSYDYLVKSDWKIEDVVVKVKAVLGL